MGRSKGKAAAVAMEGGAPGLPMRPPTNRPFVFAVAELKGAGGGRSTILRFKETGGGGAPTANDHARLTAGVEREATRLSAECTLLGGGQLCFRGGEVSTVRFRAWRVDVIRHSSCGDTVSCETKNV